MEPYVCARLAYVLILLLYSAFAVGLFAIPSVPLVVKIMLLLVLFLLWAVFACTPATLGLFLLPTATAAAVTPRTSAVELVDALPVYEPPVPPYVEVKEQPAQREVAVSSILSFILYAIL